MPLKPGMDTYQWNEYYLICAVGLLPYIEEMFIRGAAWTVDVIHLLYLWAALTLAWMREPRKKNESQI